MNSKGNDLFPKFTNNLSQWSKYQLSIVLDVEQAWEKKELQTHLSPSLGGTT